MTNPKITENEKFLSSLSEKEKQELIERLEGKCFQINKDSYILVTKCETNANALVTKHVYVNFDISGACSFDLHDSIHIFPSDIDSIKEITRTEFWNIVTKSVQFMQQSTPQEYQLKGFRK